MVRPVWYRWDGSAFLGVGKERTSYIRNLRRDPRVSLAILDPDNPYRYVEIRGRVAKVTQEGAAQHIDKMAKKYLGKDKYPWAKPGEVRVLFEIQPEKVGGNK